MKIVMILKLQIICFKMKKGQEVIKKYLNVISYKKNLTEAHFLKAHEFVK